MTGCGDPNRHLRGGNPQQSRPVADRPAWAGHREAIHSLMAMHTKGYRILYSFTVESTTPDPESSRSGPANTPLQPTAEKRGG